MNPTIELLSTRRSVPAHLLAEPGPDAATLETMLTIAARVPDHAKLVPWRFILFEGAARQRAGEKLAALVAARDPSAGPERLDEEKRRFARAPLCVCVVSRIVEHPRVPAWEQILSAGAVCLNLEIAAHALGFAACWLTEWMSTDAEAMALLGLAPNETIAGLIHIGTPTIAPSDRPRPVLADIVSRWPG